MATYAFSFKKITLPLVIILLIAALAHGYHFYLTTQRLALFEGDYELCKQESPQYFPAVDYNFPSYGEPSKPQIDSAANQTKQALDLRLPTVYRDRKPYKSLQILYPQDGSYYPPNLCAPFITWEDPQNNLWLVEISHGDPAQTYTDISETPRWRIPKSLWKRLKEEAASPKASLVVKGIELDKQGNKKGMVQVSPTLHFHIASEPADNFIVYRVVSPPFSSKKTPDLMIRDIRNDRETRFLSANRQYCINCHTFSNKMGNKGKLSLQVRCMRAANPNQNLPHLRIYLAVYDMDRQTGFKAQLPFPVQMSTFMAWSPDESKIAYSANQKLATLSPVTFETQHASTVTSDIAIYDIPNNNTYLLPGASDPNWLENYPCWSPDSRHFVFARAPTGRHPAGLLYDLYHIHEKGGKRVVEPIAGASANGLSNYYPRFSPNGRWFTFCQCDGGDLIRSSSEIFIMNGQLDAPPRRLRFNIKNAADSWHSWSSNSRWLVFVSKR
ncbi:hypothetical protein GF373_10720, partial [bacterium]|nr:hypothetical protein [bacterium]